MRACYEMYWHPDISKDSTGRHLTINEACIAARCSKATLFNARKWAIDRGMPVRPHKNGKITPVQALEMCERVWGPNAETDVSAEAIASEYGLSRARLYHTYRPRYISGELEKEAAQWSVTPGPSDLPVHSSSDEGESSPANVATI